MSNTGSSTTVTMPVMIYINSLFLGKDECILDDQGSKILFKPSPLLPLRTKPNEKVKGDLSNEPLILSLLYCNASKFARYSISNVASAIAMYSDSVDDKATVVCFFELAHSLISIRQPARMGTKTVFDEFENAQLFASLSAVSRWGGK